MKENIIVCSQFKLMLTAVNTIICLESSANNQEYSLWQCFFHERTFQAKTSIKSVIHKVKVVYCNSLVTWPLQLFCYMFQDGSCYQGDIVCEKDRLGYEAIATLHHQMDDDENGDIDLEESAEVSFSHRHSHSVYVYGCLYEVVMQLYLP